MINFLSRKKEYFLFFSCLLLFITLRLPGLSLSYHQDEMKTAVAIRDGGAAASGLHHPPLTGLLFRIDGFVFSDANYRLFPLIFSLAAAFLFFLILKTRLGTRTALWALFLFSVCFYSVLSSLMLDTDGGILVFFFVLSIYFYDLFCDSVGKKNYYFLIALFFSLLLGFLVKLSFILVICAFILDFLWENKKKITKKQIFYCIAIFFNLLFFGTITIFITHAIYPVFKIDEMINHAKSFARLGGRNYFQTIIQGIKAIFYLSPLLLAPILFVDKEIFKKTKIFFIYLVLGVLFYFVIFDFSTGALDKYLMFSVLPLSAICGAVFAKYITFQNTYTQKKFIVGSIFMALVLFLLNFLPHEVIALYPKNEWFYRVGHLRWQMLNPFTGGSGPLGFYVSFLFLMISFSMSIFFSIIGFLKNKWKGYMLIAIFCLGVTYNAVFAEELFFGKINGSTTNTLNSSLNFVENSSSIKSIITYSDSGAYELMKIGKYGGRFYAVPAYEEGHRKLFTEFQGEYLVVGIPILYEGFYKDFFSKCDILFETRSGVIKSDVFSCKKKK